MKTSDQSSQAEEQLFSHINEVIQSGPDADRLMKAFCREIGPRPAGTDNMKKGREYLSGEWKSIDGVKVHQEPVEVDRWIPGTSTVELIHPRKISYDSIQMINTAAGTVEGPLVYAGSLRLSELQRAGNRLKDAVVLVDRPDYFRGGKYEMPQKRISLAEAAGAAAMIDIGSTGDLPDIQYARHGTIPVVTVAEDAREELVSRCSGGAAQDAVVRVHTTGKTGARTLCANVIGEMGPPAENHEVIITCCHLDSHYVSPGAADNLTGVVTLTEVARVLAPHSGRFHRTFRMIAFTDEEQNFKGSKMYVRDHEKDLDSVRFVLSMDTLFQSTAEGMAVIWAPSMRDYIAGLMKDSHPELDVRNLFCMSSDYLPFILAGVPAGRPADWKDSFPKYNHTIKDTEGNVPISEIKSNVAVYSRMLYKMLTDPDPIPSNRKTQEQVSALIEEEQVEDFLRWQIGLPS